MTNLCDLHGDLSGYWPAVERTKQLCNEVGAYANFVIGVDLNGWTHAQMWQWYETWKVRYGKDPGVLLSLFNEPYQNGVKDATDPFVLEMARDLAAYCGHKDFIIGDARDGDNPDASKETIEQSKKLAEYTNMLVLHNSRLGGAQVAPDGRLRRYLDHLEGFFDVIAETHKVNPNTVGIHEEPYGQASERWVPIPGRSPYEREADWQCATIAAVSSELCGLYYCYHYVSEQNDGTPGLDVIGKLLSGFVLTPNDVYRNDSWSGSATSGFSWRGGKCRSNVNGIDGRVIVYGTDKGSVDFVNYNNRELIADAPNFQFYKVWK